MSNPSLKILVCVKKVVDANVKVRVNSLGDGVDIAHSKMSTNPFDDNALEEAIKLKEVGLTREIIAVSIGVEKCTDVLRNALARGVDRALRVDANDGLEPINIAKILKQIVKREEPDIILLGKQAIDDDSNQVGQMLSGMLDIGQALAISKLQIKDQNTVVVECATDTGVAELEFQIPLVITTDLHLNEPRFIRLPQLMQARKKNIEVLTFDDLQVVCTPRSSVLKARDGEVKKECKFLHDVTALSFLLQELKVI